MPKPQPFTREELEVVYDVLDCYVDAYQTFTKEDAIKLLGEELALRLEVTPVPDEYVVGSKTSH